MSDPLLSPVERALCCPTGCRALEAGDLSQCGAKLTKEHAEAAIAIFRRADADRVKALLQIQRMALHDADATKDKEIMVSFRELARIASKTLGLATDRPALTLVPSDDAS